MKKLSIALAALLLLSACSSLKGKDISINPIEHATAVITWDELTFYNDPTNLELLADQPAPDVILVSDIHGDHFNVETLTALMEYDPILLVPQAVKDEMPEELAAKSTVLDNGDSLKLKGFTVEAVPMYNFPETEDSRHTKGRGNGYIIEEEDMRLYFAGDTAGTPEMRTLENIDIAFIPMNLPYTMSVEEAADAVLEFKPRTVYPYHYRGQDGLSDVEAFKKLVEEGNSNIDVELLNWYPNQ